MCDCSIPQGGDCQAVEHRENSSVSVGWTVTSDAAGTGGDNVLYELWNDTTVRFTHPIASGPAGKRCGETGSIFFTDHPISISIDGVKYYYLYDGLGSVTELIDENENVVNTYRYMPFGSPLVRNEGVYNPYQFTGRRYDPETGQYYYRARMYSPEIGRFLQVDPAGMVDGANMYAYAGDSLKRPTSTDVEKYFALNPAKAVAESTPVPFLINKKDMVRPGRLIPIKNPETLWLPPGPGGTGLWIDHTWVNTYDCFYANYVTCVGNCGNLPGCADYCNDWAYEACWG